METFLPEFVEAMSSQVVYSTALFAVVFFLARFFRMRPLLTLGLWTLVLLRLVLPPGLSHAYSGRMLLERAVVPAEAQQSWIEGVGTQAASTGLEAAQRDVVAGLPGITIDACLFAAWLVGALWFGGLHVGRLRYFGRLVRSAEAVTDAGCLRLLGKWKDVYRVRRPLRLIVGKPVCPPFTMGFLRPVIYLPSGLHPERDSKTIEAIIAHELAHVANFDDLWTKLQDLVRIVYWFHPVAWLATREINEARECVRDASVLSKRMIKASDYGNGLLDVVRANSLRDSLAGGAVPAFASSKRRLAERIRHIKHSGGFGWWQRCSSALALGACAFLLLPMGDAATTAMESILFHAPVRNGHIVLEFGMDFVGPPSDYRFHRGLDIASPDGHCGVVAVADSVVLSVERDDIEEALWAVTLGHGNGIQTRYLHLDSVAVVPGQVLRAGDMIGQAPSVLHFETLQNGLMVDPEIFLKIEKRLSRRVIKLVGPDFRD